ncbi:Zinc finger CCCH domain-containing protein 18 [Striga hermonthica]|uniref:Zinc finger CCCH domain-containing protein 18 n=1 Tax=Striga hermonthica TaxID=68872 RepID=A0A9N7NU24_STRHE|nr:Zinc finger CCCH domain-containing protein 18 [Striga hermonthica]
MEYSESTKVVFKRIEKLDPENVSKIIGYLLLKDQGELEMIRLAFGPDNLIHSLINTAKRELDSSPTKPAAHTKFTPHVPWCAAPVPPNKIPWIVPTPQPSFSLDIDGYVVHNQPSFGLEIGPYFHDCCPPALICQSFSQGYCKYGGNCWFLHVFRMENGRFMVLNQPGMGEDHVLWSTASLKQLEIELIELLKARKGVPVSISSLPIFYYDKYGRALRVEGYLVEGPWQRKIRFTLAQLVAQMTKDIHVDDRPHGRQSIIMVEDILLYARWMEEKKENESVSCQVYLTFPPHSMFNEEDVYNYFNNFGPVQEVRLPNQEKRMFGFVTFVYPETVTLVLSKTNPHFICGAKVLVKPYRIKSLLLNRKSEKVHNPVKQDPQSPDKAESDPSSKAQTVFVFSVSFYHVLPIPVSPVLI